MLVKDSTKLLTCRNLPSVHSNFWVCFPCGRTQTSLEKDLSAKQEIFKQNSMESPPHISPRLKSSFSVCMSADTGDS